MLSTDSHPASPETAGVLISWDFFFFNTNHTNLNGSTRGGLLSDHPHGQNHSHSLGLSPQRHNYGSESVPIVQGLVQDLNVYKTHSRTVRFARYADERNVGCVYHRKGVFNQEPNHIYRVRENYNGCFLSRRCSIYKAN